MIPTGKIGNCPNCRQIKCICPKQFGSAAPEAEDSKGELEKRLQDVYEDCLQVPGKHTAFYQFLLPEIRQILRTHGDKRYEEGFDEGMRTRNSGKKMYELGEKEERKRVVEFVVKYTVDLCENSQQFKIDLLAYLKELQK